MKSKTYIISLFFILFFVPKKSISQQIINLPEVDLIVFEVDDTDFRLFKKDQTNTYIEIYLDFVKNQENDYVSAEIDYSNKRMTYKDIVSKTDGKIINVKELQDSKITDYQNKQWKIVNPKWESIQDKNNKFVFKILSSELSVMQEFYFGKYNYSRGFGSKTINKADNKIEKWRVSKADYFQIIDLNFGKNKHIYLQNRSENTEYTDYIFFTTDDNYILSDDYGMSKLKEVTKYKTDSFETFQKLDANYYYTLYKNKKGKYQLHNPFGRDVLQTEFDTITFNQYYIIAKQKKQISIFNPYLKKIKIEKIKSAYLYKSGLEILTNKGANYYDANLKIVKEFPTRSYMLCGTVNSTGYNLGYDKDYKYHYLSKSKGGFATQFEEKRKYYLEDIKKREKVTFLDGSKEYSWDDNDSYMENNYMEPELLKVKKRKKYGIKEYLFTFYVSCYSFFPVDTINTFLRKEIIYPDKYITGKIVLPINNDSIVYNRSNGIILFYRKKKVGIFPRDKTVQYKNMEQKTNSFYVITRKRKKGWIDIKTNIEYFED